MPRRNLLAVYSGYLSLLAALSPAKVLGRKRLRPLRTPASAATLTEIIVTATKRVESVQSVPISISAVSQSQLQAQNVSDTADLSRQVPNAIFNQTFRATFTVRFMGATAGGVGIDQPQHLPYPFNVRA